MLEILGPSNSIHQSFSVLQIQEKKERKKKTENKRNKMHKQTNERINTQKDTKRCQFKMNHDHRTSSTAQ